MLAVIIDVSREEKILNDILNVINSDWWISQTYFANWVIIVRKVAISSCKANVWKTPWDYSQLFISAMLSHTEFCRVASIVA